jgi:uracil permease
MPKLGALISTVPSSVIGGISIVLFGMISAVGARSLVENKVNFKDTRNLLVAAVILVIGLGGTEIPIQAGAFSISISPIALAAIVGVLLNKILFIPIHRRNING